MRGVRALWPGHPGLGTWAPLGLGVLLALIVLPWMVRLQAGAIRHHQEEVTRFREMEVRMRRFASTQDTLRIRHGRMASVEEALIPGLGEAAAGNLGTLLSGVASDAGVGFSSVRLAADSSRWSSFNEVTAQVRFNTTDSALSRFLLALERGAPLLSVSDVSISRFRVDRGREVMVEMTVKGLGLKGARIDG